MSALSELHEKIRQCQKCELARYRNSVVPGEGVEDADIMFIGEAPGWHEDQQGRPFVGPAGKFLEELLGLIDLKRQQVYIANVIKCRPQKNRDPLPQEIMACRPWLERQVELIRPQIIVTLGRFSMALFFPQKSIGKIHGTAEKHDGIIYYAMYHPAAALHQQSLRETIKTDMLKIPQLLAQVKNTPEAEKEPEIKQMNMFEV
ncbi:MAG: uracil-DNA glycosylase [Chloroflexota bacterium]